MKRNFLLLLLLLFSFFLIISCGSDDSSSSGTSTTTPTPSTPNTSVNVQFSGNAIDAPLAYADVNLKAVGSDTPLTAGTRTDNTGAFTLPGVDLSTISSTAILYLHIEGQADSNTCSDSASSKTFVDVSGDGSFDTGTDECIGTGAELKSYLGVTETISDLNDGTSGVIDSADLPELMVTHVTTAKSIIVEKMISDASADADPEKTTYIMDTIDSMLETDDNMKKQVAMLATIIRAATHNELDANNPIGTSVNDVGLMETIKQIAEETLVLDATDDAEVNTLFQNDTSGFLVTELDIDVDEDLGEVSFENEEMAATLQSFDTIQVLNDQYLADLLAQIATYSGGSVNSSALNTWVTSNYHEKYLHDGRDRFQKTNRLIDWLATHPIEEEILLDVRLSHLCDATGDLYFDESTEQFVYDVSADGDVNLPVYRKLGQGITRYSNNTIENWDLKGYVILDAENKLKDIGNRVKFDVRLSALNDAGNKRIKLQVRDPQSETLGGRFTITGVKVEVRDTGSNFEALTAAQLDFNEDGVADFKNDCTEGDSVNSAIICLNHFNLGSFGDSDWMNWGNQEQPGTDAFGSDYMIPYMFSPSNNAVFKFTITYTDSDGVYSGTEIIEKKLGPFPSDDYLPKLVDADGNAVFGAIVGNDSKVTLNWTYKKHISDGKMYYPSQAYQLLWLWDEVENVSVSATGTDYHFSSNIRTMELVGDFSNRKILTAGIVLRLPNGSEVKGKFQLIRIPDGDWYANGLAEGTLIDVINVYDDLDGGWLHTGRDIWPDIITVGAITDTMKIEDYGAYQKSNENGSDDFVLYPWEQYWDLDWDNGAGIENAFWTESAGDYPGFSVSLTANFDGILRAGDKALMIPRWTYKTPADHVPQNVLVSGSMVGENFDLDISWAAPVSSSTLLKNSERVYQVRIYTRNGSDDGWDQKHNQRTSGLSISKTLTPADITKPIRVRIQAYHNGGSNVATYNITCSVDQITEVSDPCSSTTRTSWVVDDGLLLTEGSNLSFSLSSTEVVKYIKFAANANQPYHLDVSGDTDHIEHFQLFDSNWVKIPTMNSHGDRAFMTDTADDLIIMIRGRFDEKDPLDFVLSIKSENLVDLTEGVPVNNQVTTSTDHQFYYLDMNIAGVYYHVKAEAPVSDDCTEGADFRMFNLEEGYGWNDIAGWGFAPSGDFHFYTKSQDLDTFPSVFWVRPPTWGTAEEDCRFNLLVEAISEPGTSFSNPVSISESDNVQWHIKPDDIKYFEFTPTNESRYRFEYNGESGVVFELYEDISEVTSVALTCEDAIDGSNRHYCDADSALTAGDSYYLKAEKSGGAGDDDSFNLSIFVLAP